MSTPLDIDSVNFFFFFLHTWLSSSRCCLVYSGLDAKDDLSCTQ